MNAVVKRNSSEVWSCPSISLDHYSKPVVLVYRRGYISSDDLSAAHQIEHAITLIENDGLQNKSLHRSRVGAVKFEPGHKQQSRLILTDQLEVWLKQLYQKSIPAGAILDLLIERKSLCDVDRRFRKTNGWARMRLVEGLKLWSSLFIEGKG